MAETPTSLSYQGNAAASDLTGSQAECTLGRGAGSSDEPAGSTATGSTDFGFTDTTYSLTAAQVQAGSLMGA